MAAHIPAGMGCVLQPFVKPTKGNLVSNVTAEEIKARIAALRPLSQKALELLQAQAISYVWGWQDARGDEKDSEKAWEFGQAYRLHALLFAEEKQGYRNNIPDAWKKWSESGAI